MNALVVYDSKFGNTARIAQAIGAGLRERFEVQVQPVTAALVLPPDLGLLAVGGPTHSHGLSEPMRAFLKQLRGTALSGLPALAFDTRFQLPTLISGSAAGKIGRMLEASGAHLIAPAISFFVTRAEEHPLEPGEEQRASAWIAAVLANLGVPA